MSVDKENIAKDDLKILVTFGVIILPAVAVSYIYPQYLFSHHLTRVAMVFAGGVVQVLYPDTVSFLCNYGRPKFIGTIHPLTIKKFGFVFIAAAVIYLIIAIVFSI